MIIALNEKKFDAIMMIIALNEKIVVTIMICIFFGNLSF